MGRVVKIRDGVTTNTDYPDFPEPAIDTDITDAIETAADVANRQKWTFNFSAAGNAKLYAHEAMTVSAISSVGAGALSYKKSTAAAPATFNATAMPATLEAGAWLEVTATGVVSVHLEQTS